MAQTNRYDPHPAYRPEIDGMRAIAVMAVVLYHFSVPGVGGGLVGVDIFFVISGFLIGGILWREQAQNGRIDLVRFYLRRVRRLAPAFFAMALAALVVGWAVLLPFEFREFGKELIASASYLANVHFYRETGYFDAGAETKILLHNWSLAVEEQFYLFLPFFILLLRRRQSLLIASLWALFALSLAGCIWLTGVNQPAAFYLFPLRAWELLAGVLLAVHAGEGRTGGGSFALSALGLALMLAGIVWVRPGAGFPGWQVALPVAGAVLALMSGRHANPVNWALASPPAVFIGKISYSLYLWHWPVFTLSLYWRGSYSGPLEALGWMALAFVLATLSWRFIEQPVRRSARIGNRGLLALWLAGTMLALGFGTWIYLRDGAPERFAQATRTHIDATADFLQDWSRCHVPAQGPLEGVELCPIGPEGTPQVLIWGDSHLRAVKEGLDLAAHEAAMPGLVVWVAGCPPLFGLTKSENTTNAAEDLACIRTTERIETAMQAGALPNRLMLVARWSYYAEGRGIGLDAQNTILLKARNAGLRAPDQATLLAHAFAASLGEMSQHFDAIYLLRQPPEIPFYDSRIFAREAARGRLNAEEATQPRALAEARAARGEAPLKQAEAAGQATILDTWPYFCGPETCTAMPDGKARYFDNNHVTNSAGLEMRALFAPLFAGGAP